MTEESRGDKKELRRIERTDYAKQGDNASKLTINPDVIRKESILRERKVRGDWSRKYHHLTGQFFRKILAEECEKAGLPPDTFEREHPEDFAKNLFITPPASPPIPKTTSATVGWRSGRPECNIEFAGPLYVSPKTTIEPPPEPGEFRVTHQRFIFLG